MVLSFSKFRPIVLFLFLLGIFSGSVCAAGLSIDNYGEVLVENLQPGNTYSMIELVNLPLKVTNKDTTANTIKLEVQKPAGNDLKKGFEPIPDTAWIEITPLQVEIAANGTYSTDIKINLPKDAKYVGKKYQVDIKASIAPSPTSMVSVALAVKGRLLFTTAQNSQAPKKLSLNFTFSPARVIMMNVPLGKKVAVQNSSDKKDLSLKNADNAKSQVILQSLDPKDTPLPKDPDYEICPSANFLTFEKEEFAVDGGQIVPVKAFVEIPDKPEFKGKSYQFLISAKIGDANSGQRYVQVLVNTQK
jgi:hypothetical protein